MIYLMITFNKKSKKIKDKFVQLLKKITIIKNTFKVFRYMIKDHKKIKI